MKKLLFICILLLTLLAPVTVRATVGPFALESVIFVDGVASPLWGVRNDIGISAVRLRDLAYLLNGTPAQFDLRPTGDDALAYWVIRGAPYTPLGNEMQPICCYYIEEYNNIAWFGGVFSRVLVGIDGTTTPETVVEFTAYQDNCDYYFPLNLLGALLGFTMDWTRMEYYVLDQYHLHEHYVEGANYVISTGTRPPADIPVQSVEFLNLMHRLDSHWVHDAHYRAAIIDESVVWPTELFFSHEGHGVRFNSWRSVAPAHRAEDNFWRYWYPVEMRTLECGRIELAVAGQMAPAWTDAHAYNAPGVTHAYTPSRRIVVDARGDEIGELFLYIDGTAHRMVNAYNPPRDARRYSVAINEAGHVVLNYVLGQPTIWQISGIQIFRTAATGDDWKVIYARDTLDRRDRLFFEFIDTTAEPGHTYDYMIGLTGLWGPGIHSVTEGKYHIRAHVPPAAVEELQEAQETETEDPVEAEAAPAPDKTPGRRGLWFLPSAGIGLGLVIYIFAIGKRAASTPAK
jgi:hypothetical protein